MGCESAPVPQGNAVAWGGGTDSGHIDHPSPKISGRRDLCGAKAANKLQRGLSNLSTAPLKPQQRLYILKHHLLSALYHELVLTPCLDKFMNWLDRST